MNQIPVIINTDIGMDPDDIVALLIALRSSILDIRLIITSEDKEGLRYRLVKKILEYVGRSDIKVVRGDGSKFSYHFLIDSIRLQKAAPIKDGDMDYIGAIKSVIEEVGNIYFVGISSLTNLSNYIRTYPNDVNKIILYQMGGSERKYEYNFNLDAMAAENVLHSGMECYIVTSEITNNPAISVGMSSRLYSLFLLHKKKGAKEFELLLENIENFPRFNLHDPLTISTLMNKDFVKFEKYDVKFKWEELGHRAAINQYIRNQNSRISISTSCDYAKFMEWIEDIFS